MSKNVKRLFGQFQPDNYNINITISKDKLSFSGFVTIHGVRKSRPLKRITLHQKALKITNPKISYIDKDGVKTSVDITRIMHHESYDEVRLHTKAKLYPGKYILTMEFTGKITKNMEGIYPCLFTDSNVQKKLIATQFESHHAREVFPCIDEPEAKAIFKLTLTHAKHEVALSNTKKNNETIRNDLKTTEFKKTPLMSTYLLAFVVGELESLQTKSKNGVLIRTFATKDQLENSRFALEVASKFLDFYEEYFDIKYPLEKCDFIALPDFANGAMENWGLITFREQTMLVDSRNTTRGTKQYIALVVAHELTHQWFGNLVTMQWWADLWLNEGFASWMAYLAVDKSFPEWNIWAQFAVDEKQPALKLDALEHTHPVEVPVHHPDEIRTIFDVISYEKGASVIDMLQDYLGADVFRNGLRHYLKKYSYKNTKTADLWEALEKVSHKEVSKFMNVWTSRPGYPLLVVNQINDHIRIEQSRFVVNPTSKSREDKTLWPVPLLSKGLDRKLITKKKENAVITNQEEPIMLNNSQRGFYRVIYADKIQKSLLSRLRAGEIEAIGRTGLLSDSLEATRAGYQTINEFLDLLNEYSGEDSLSTWGIIAIAISSIRSILSESDTDDTLREAIKPYLGNFVKPQVKLLGWKEKPGEPHLEALLRPLILALSATSEDKDTIQKALIMFDDQSKKKLAIPPDLRSMVYTTAVKHSQNNTFDTLLNMYKATSSSEEKLSITSAMTSFKDTETQKNVLALIKTDIIRLQDVGYWIAYSVMNRHSRQTTWQWIKNNWQWLVDNLGTDLSFSRMPLYVAKNINETDMLTDYKQFFEANMNLSIQRTYNQGLEIAQTNIAWRERDSKKALIWFTKN